MSIFKKSERGGLYARLRERGYIVEDAKISGLSVIRIIAPNGLVWVTGKKMAYPMNSAFIHQISDNKRLSYELASSLSIRTPKTMYVDRSMGMEELHAFLKQYPLVVVKPLDSYKSHGVTIGVNSMDIMPQALEHAYQESPVAIIQEQVGGEEYRFTILEGAVVSVLRRERPQVIGDGVSTVRQLVSRENSTRRDLILSDAIYPQWTVDLIGDVVMSEDIPGIGEVRILSGATLVSKGASLYELRGDVDASYVALAERFATTVGAGFVAIDMFIVDHQVEASKGHYWFNECIASPSLKMYVSARNEDNHWIVDKIVDTTDNNLNFTQ